MRCLQCGKEISEGRKFCSSSCSAKYNNVRRIRKPWTEEQHRKNRKLTEQKFCKYCGKPGKTVCDECKPFVQRVRTFDKLNIKGSNLKEKNQKLLELLKDLYFVQHQSLEEIWEKTGLRYRQVEIIFHSAGLSLRNLSECQTNALSVGRRDLPKPLEKRGIRGYHKTWQGEKIWYRSSYELAFAQLLDSQKIPYKVEAKETRTKYRDSELQRERVAVPDFYLPKTNEIIEVKSKYTLGNIQRMKEKFEAYQKRGFIPKLWLDFKFEELRNLQKYGKSILGRKMG